ncbi:hypothetical protein KOW79_015218 [Hemibagrus wyckioides]|uniref:Uncharacterized protein n=1 Tax=Hemibagrus wyckioides TaxID=337641 RepID=A0A9D3NGC8_9TELE|nr:hypothetical protein KOW79_015218 [Hemibagrus wyckioides]
MQSRTGKREKDEEEDTDLVSCSHPLKEIKPRSSTLLCLPFLGSHPESPLPHSLPFPGGVIILKKSPAALLIYRCSAAQGAINHHNAPNHDLYCSRDGCVGARDKLLTDGVCVSQCEFRRLGATGSGEGCDLGPFPYTHTARTLQRDKGARRCMYSWLQQARLLMSSSWDRHRWILPHASDRCLSSDWVPLQIYGGGIEQMLFVEKDTHI